MHARPSGLLVPTLELAAGDRRQGAPLMQELAPQTGGRDITRGIIDGLPLLPMQDPIAGRDSTAFPLDTYIQVLTDSQCYSALAQRRLAVVATEWEVIPGGERRRDKQAAELIDAVLNALAWDQITAQMHHGVFFGHAHAEVLWQRDGAHVVPGELRVRDPRRFAWRPDGTPVLLTVGAPDGEALPPRKFWDFRTGAFHCDDPYGMGLAHWCYWPVQFKRGVAKLWLIRLDKHGSPTALGHFPPSASEDERDKLLAALEAIRSQAAIILPEGMTAELLSANQSGAESYREAAEYWDGAISKVILGHSAGQDSTPGRLGGEDNADEVRADLVKADADVLCASANASWVRWTVEWSYPGAAIPQLWRRTEEEEDLTSRATREKLVFDMGYRPTLAQIRSTYGGDWEPVLRAPANEAPRTGMPGDEEPPRRGAGTADMAAGAEGAESPVDQLSERLAAEAQPAVAEWLERIEAMLAAATSLEEARAMLTAAFDELGADEATRAFGEGITVALAAGRYDVAAEGDG